MQRSSGVAAAFVVLILLFAACSGAGSDDSSGDSATEEASPDEGPQSGDGGESARSAPAPADEAPAEAAQEGSADGAGGSLAVPAVLQPVDIGRSIVFTAAMTVEVDDVARAGDEALREIQGIGGLLFGQETSTDPEPRTVLTFKVLPSDFQEALSRLSGLGALVDQVVSSDDVTARVVDLESQIATAAASVERLRGLLDSAGNIEEIARLESQLLERETHLEQLRGQLRTLQAQVDLATIVLTIRAAQPPPTEPSVRLVQTMYQGHDDGGSCPGDRKLEADRDTAVTVCFAVVNTGSTAFVDLSVVDDELEITAADMRVVRGTVDGRLEPRDRAVLAYETTVTGDLATDAKASAVPVDESGTPLPGGIVKSSSSVQLVALGADPLPGFGDTVAASFEVLLRVLGMMLVVFAGAVLPFAWLVILVAVIVWFVRRRNRRDTSPAT